MTKKIDLKSKYSRELRDRYITDSIDMAGWDTLVEFIKELGPGLIQWGLPSIATVKKAASEAGFILVESHMYGSYALVEKSPPKQMFHYDVEKLIV